MSLVFFSPVQDAEVYRRHGSDFDPTLPSGSSTSIVPFVKARVLIFSFFFSLFGVYSTPHFPALLSIHLSGAPPMGWVVRTTGPTSRPSHTVGFFVVFVRIHDTLSAFIMPSFSFVMFYSACLAHPFLCSQFFFLLQIT